MFVLGCLGLLPSICLRIASALPLLCLCFALPLANGGAPLAFLVEGRHVTVVKDISFVCWVPFPDSCERQEATLGVDRPLACARHQRAKGSAGAVVKVESLVQKLEVCVYVLVPWVPLQT